MIDIWESFFSFSAGSKPAEARFVRALEADPPEGEAGIEWMLVTTMPVTHGATAPTWFDTNRR
jgi:hypothetical protein